MIMCVCASVASSVAVIHDFAFPSLLPFSAVSHIVSQDQASGPDLQASSDQPERVRRRLSLHH